MAPSSQSNTKQSVGNRVVLMAAAVAAAALSSGSAAHGAITLYTADANTLHLYHFDETAGAGDPGNPIVDYGSGALNLTNTGGPDGRDNAGIGGDGGYGASAYSGFGSAFNILESGTGSYSSGANPAAGGVRSSGAVTQASLQGASGAFTYEALILLNNLGDAEQAILSHDGNMSGDSAGNTGRGFQLRLLDTADAGTNVDSLNFFNGITGGSGSFSVALPTTGDHALTTGAWFHVAVAYDGQEGVAGNLSFFWTRLDSGATQANQLASTHVLSADLTNASDGNWFGVGTGTRGEFRNQLKGLVDEVRISSVARGADDFVFSVPEPGVAGLVLVGGLALARRRRCRP